MRIFKLAVTGSAGSGKSLVCQRLFHLGWPVFDCDRIARRLVEPGQPAYERMIDLFGKEVVLNSGDLDRGRIREMMVRSPDRRKKMEAMLHPAIVKSLFDKIELTAAGGRDRVAAEVPLLFELDLDRKFDYCVTVAVEREKMIGRIAERDHVSRESARKILALQMDTDEKIRRSDHVIHNNGGIGELLDLVDVLHVQLEKQILTIDFK